MSASDMSCELCSQPGGDILLRQDGFRVVLVAEPGYPGFCRVIADRHVREMTDLPVEQRTRLMDAVWRVEAAVREVMQPAKINLAALGNMVPHVHWHVIPRYADDRHFPAPIWALPKRAPDAIAEAGRAALLPALRAAIIRQFAPVS